MLALPPNMLEATRFVREGRLLEATALLRGAAAPAPSIPLEPRVPFLNPARETPNHQSSRETPAGARFENLAFRSAEGVRPYKLYIPSTYNGRPAPLIVMLHGCTQSADDFAAGTRMNEHAEAEGFLVVYPEQTQAANASRCWNWFEAREQRRGHGEPAIVAGIVTAIGQSHAVDPARVFAAGLSAGGAAAATLGVLYPDVFAAIGVHSGLACGSALDVTSAFSAMRRGGGAIRARRVCRAIIFHGDRDMTVDVANAVQVASQGECLQTEVIDSGLTKGGCRFTRTRGLDAEQRIVTEQWVVHGAGHAWFGGSAKGSYTDPSGPDASAEMVRFFLG